MESKNKKGESVLPTYLQVWKSLATKTYEKFRFEVFGELENSFYLALLVMTKSIHVIQVFTKYAKNLPQNMRPAILLLF